MHHLLERPVVARTPLTHACTAACQSGSSSRDLSAPSCDLVGGGESRITEGQRARWNPTDPDEFVFTRQSAGVWTLWKYSFRSGQERDLNKSPADKFDPEYSPDGQWISFTSNEEGSSDIWVMRADGSQAKSIDKHGAIDCQAVWAPDGKSLLFTTNREGSFDICQVPLSESDLGGAEPPPPPAGERK